MMEHSPTPWYAVKHSNAAVSIQTRPEGVGLLVATCRQPVAEADANLIVKAVNNYQPLLDALKEIAQTRDVQYAGQVACAAIDQAEGSN